MRMVVVAAEPITDVDTTAADMLIELARDLEEGGVELAFAEMKGPPKDKLEAYGLLRLMGEPRFYPTVGAAVHAVRGRLRRGVAGLGGPGRRGRRQAAVAQARPPDRSARVPTFRDAVSSGRAAQDRVDGAVGIGLGGRPVADADAHRGLALPGRSTHPGRPVGLDAPR